uniref:Uncharacterized protein n=1 Tax=Anguilla anguilla TaxID=7936 RepID=A0A0E9PI05_ANGAN
MYIFQCITYYLKSKNFIFFIPCLAI